MSTYIEDDDHFDELWDEEIRYDYYNIMGVDAFCDEEGYLKDNVLDAIDDYIRPAMIRRAKEWGDDVEKPYTTRSMGCFVNLKDINKDEKASMYYEDRFIHIMYRLHQWCWGNETIRGKDFSTFEQHQLLSQDVISAIADMPDWKETRDPNDYEEGEEMWPFELKPV